VGSVGKSPSAAKESFNHKQFLVSNFTGPQTSFRENESWILTHLYTVILRDFREEIRCDIRVRDCLCLSQLYDNQDDSDKHSNGCRNLNPVCDPA
jgi:hypothetical protein